METHFGGKPALRTAMRRTLDAAPFEPARRRAAVQRLLAAAPFADARRVAIGDDPSARMIAERLEGTVEFAALDEPLQGPVDLIVAPAIAVTRGGKHCGNGEGLIDLAFAIARLSGHAIVPVVAAVEAIQVVRFFPTYEHDVELSWIATPDELIEVPGPVYAPAEIFWEHVEDGHYLARPDLASLRGH